MRAIILAGGKGSRLRPYTAVLPKPLMPINDCPIMELVVNQLRNAGFTRLTIAVGHLAGLIQAYFGDGDRFGIPMDYSLETTPLGTAGPLSIIDPPDDDFLVMNGDIMTDLDFRDFAAAHRASGAVASLVAYKKPVHIDLGVIDVDEQGHVTGYTEKPTLTYLVSTGIYCFSPRVLGYLEKGARLDLPDLMLRLMARGETVNAYRFDGRWLDIGRVEDYEEAVQEYAKGAFR